MSIQIVNNQFQAFVSFAQEALRTDAGENSVAQSFLKSVCAVYV